MDYFFWPSWFAGAMPKRVVDLCDSWRGLVIMPQIAMTWRMIRTCLIWCSWREMKEKSWGLCTDNGHAQDFVFQNSHPSEESTDSNGVNLLDFLYSQDCEQPLGRWLSCVYGLHFLCVLMKSILLIKHLFSKILPNLFCHFFQY